MQNLSNATTIKIELNLTPEKKSSKREAFSFFSHFFYPPLALFLSCFLCHLSHPSDILLSSRWCCDDVILFCLLPLRTRQQYDVGEEENELARSNNTDKDGKWKKDMENALVFHFFGPSFLPYFFFALPLLGICFTLFQYVSHSYTKQAYRQQVIRSSFWRKERQLRWKREDMDRSNSIIGKEEGPVKIEIVLRKREKERESERARVKIGKLNGNCKHVTKYPNSHRKNSGTYAGNTRFLIFVITYTQHPSCATIGRNLGGVANVKCPYAGASSTWVLVEMKWVRNRWIQSEISVPRQVIWVFIKCAR